VPDEGPQLYQVLGAALRDVAQARFMSDLYSRQISYKYEQDPLLRRFPVPRVDLDEVEISLQFAISQVAVDPARHTSRNSAGASLFAQYSIAIVRDVLTLLRSWLPKTKSPPPADSPDFDSRLCSDETLQRLNGRLLQYFDESTDDILNESGALKEDAVVDALTTSPATAVLLQPEVSPVKDRFTDNDWGVILTATHTGFEERVKQLAKEIAGLRNKYPDFKLVVEVDAATLQNVPRPLSTIRIKSSVKNYTWAKVDVDSSDLRHIRTLTPE
jgi:hypothetical protein